ncbi:MAG: 4-hydroxythreonine-4-phosphate dehydrogenase PdxA [Nitrososphaerales archaeon]
MIGVTLGDPAGVGPEIVAKSLPELAGEDLVLIGNRDNFLSTMAGLGLDERVASGSRFVDIPGGPVRHGAVQKAAGEIAVRSIERAVELAMGGEVDSIATSPINKEAIIMAGSKYIDHTTMLSGLTGSKENFTVFETDALRVFFMTKHVSLVEACKQVTRERVRASIREAERCLALLGVERRRIAVAALNPHAGEGGLFGREEADAIAPAVEDARREGLDASGPFPADSVFHRASEGGFEIVVALYHDQGHIAAKMLDFHRTVSLNLGLPFLRTSVDHGTAFDIAGKGLASPVSMVEAIRKAARYGGPYRERYARLR